MATKKTKAAPVKEAAAKEETPAAPLPKISKADAVRAALAEGHDLPELAVAFIKGKFGLDMTRSAFSTYKSLEKGRIAKKAGSSNHGRTGTESNGTQRPAKSGSPDLIDALASVKVLVEQYGVDQVKQLADLLRR